MIHYFPPRGGYSVFPYLFSFFCVFVFFLLSAKFSRVYQAGTRGEIIFCQAWERLEYSSEMDEKQLSNWPWSSRF